LVIIIVKVKYLLTEDLYNTDATRRPVLKVQKDTGLQLAFYPGVGFTCH